MQSDPFWAGEPVIASSACALDALPLTHPPWGPLCCEEPHGYGIHMHTVVVQNSTTTKQIKPGGLCVCACERDGESLKGSRQ